MFFTFARVGAATALRVESYYVVGRDNWMLLEEKGGRENCILVSYVLADYLNANIDAAGLAADPKGPLFRSSRGWADRLSDRALLPCDAWQMIKTSARDAGIRTRLCNHSCRAGGITFFRQHGGSLERAKDAPGMPTCGPTLLYDHSQIAETRAEVERMAL